MVDLRCGSNQEIMKKALFSYIAGFLLIIYLYMYLEKSRDIVFLNANTILIIF